MLRHSTFDGPRSGGIGARTVGFTINIRQSDGIPELVFSFNRECADILGKWPVSALHRIPEIFEAGKVHANSDHAVNHIVEASSLPGACEVAWPRHWPRVNLRASLHCAWIEHRGGVPKHPADGQPPSGVPHRSGDNSTGAGDAAHLAHGDVGLGDKGEDQK